MTGRTKQLKRENSFSDAIIARLASVTSPQSSRKGSVATLDPILDEDGPGEFHGSVADVEGANQEARAILQQVQKLQDTNRRLQAQVTERDAQLEKQAVVVAGLRDELDEALAHAEQLEREAKLGGRAATEVHLPATTAQQAGTLSRLTGIVGRAPCVCGALTPPSPQHLAPAPHTSRAS